MNGRKAALFGVGLFTSADPSAALDLDSYIAFRVKNHENTKKSVDLKRADSALQNLSKFQQKNGSTSGVNIVNKPVLSSSKSVFSSLFQSEATKNSVREAAINGKYFDGKEADRVFDQQTAKTNQSIEKWRNDKNPYGEDISSDIFNEVAGGIYDFAKQMLGKESQAKGFTNTSNIRQYDLAPSEPSEIEKAEPDVVRAVDQASTFAPRDYDQFVDGAVESSNDYTSSRDPNYGPQPDNSARSRPARTPQAFSRRCNPGAVDYTTPFPVPGRC
ncbi:hypothetical protein [Ensifer adhaerens]|uniref:hypothetical protein n=1 Tax=Ensifer adhaerens TaxID=106592 RepID=UPI00131A3D29|nr:hypothetical protein [Ensifer adhaerens]